jgi:hypothetical protein
MAVNLKNLDFSLLSEFLVGKLAAKNVQLMTEGEVL